MVINSLLIDFINQISRCPAAHYKLMQKGANFTAEMVETLGFQLYLYEKQYCTASLDEVCRKISDRFNERYGEGNQTWNCFLTNGWVGSRVDHQAGFHIAMDVSFRLRYHHVMLWRTTIQGGLNSSNFNFG